MDTTSQWFHLRSLSNNEEGNSQRNQILWSKYINNYNNCFSPNKNCYEMLKRIMVTIEYYDAYNLKSKR